MTPSCARACVTIQICRPKEDNILHRVSFTTIVCITNVTNNLFLIINIRRTNCLIGITDPSPHPTHSMLVVHCQVVVVVMVTKEHWDATGLGEEGRLRTHSARSKNQCGVPVSLTNMSMVVVNVPMRPRQVFLAYF